MQHRVVTQSVAGWKLNPHSRQASRAPPGKATSVSTMPVQPLLAVLLERVPSKPANVIQTGKANGSHSHAEEHRVSAQIAQLPAVGSVQATGAQVLGVGIDEEEQNHEAPEARALGIPTNVQRNDAEHHGKSHGAHAVVHAHKPGLPGAHVSGGIGLEHE
jgi:hypothetical protein